jgi:hypothetical protein
MCKYVIITDVFTETINRRRRNKVNEPGFRGENPNAIVSDFSWGDRRIHGEADILDLCNSHNFVDG